MILKIVAALLLICGLSFGDTPVLSDVECKKIITQYKIDPKIKSKRGWEQIFKSRSWHSKFLLDKYSRSELDCLEKYIIRNAMDVKAYSRFVGMEFKL